MLLLPACKPEKKLLANQYLVNKVKIDVPRDVKIPLENFEEFYRQKPNRMFFAKVPYMQVHFFVWWYNLFDAEKMARHKAERNLRYDKINAGRILKNEKENARRAAIGKKPVPPHFKDKESPTLAEDIRDIGEAPVILDSALTEQTRYQLSKYLFIKGYFNNEVKDTVIITKHRKLATVKYILKPKSPFTIQHVAYQIDDEKLAPFILRDSLHCLIKKGSNYDKEIFQAERQRITDFALNNGYYFYENIYTDFSIDTSLAAKKVQVTVHIKKFARAFASNTDSLEFVPHPQYHIKNLYIITDAVIGNVRDAVFRDTVVCNQGKQVFLLNKALAYKKNLLLDNIDLYAGQLFKKDSAQHTYKQLLSLGVFKNVTIQFFVDKQSDNGLNCYIICSPLLKQSITSEIEGTNTSGNLGIDGSLLWQNKNSFKGGELIELKLQGSLSAQAQFNTQETSGSNLNNFNKTFNTIQFGPEATFAVPRAFFPFSLLPFKRDMSPRTYIKTGVNYQSRPQFNRVISSIDYGFSFKTHQNTLKHDFIPFELYMVKANLSETFKTSLADYNDAFLLNSFQNHITSLTRYSMTYLSKENSNTSNKPVNYLRVTIQSSGNLLREAMQLSAAKTDSLNRYLILGIPFAQFLKADVDYRYYVPVRKKSRLVYRVAAGLAKPLRNLTVLPYEQSFFSGGPNSIRAWRARTLGPGGYDPRNSTTRYDKIGDMLLEANLEYRFHIINSFNGAFFVDAGNIWRLKQDINKVNGEFVLSKFADQIAIGSGMGIRWDLNFFVLRMDLAIPIKDPKYSAGDRWTFNKKPYEYLVANFGIGYPF
jgi:outer membrane protein assembly factor BamA